ncbi:ATP-binding protein [Aquimarina aggregata]|uniref:ATP-binding protein n=1 Tax=Aquimarina aggregata TaxID=1642818 RepID=UPI00249014C5|nr:ATP-binding protein [Aquimarina aggregata]
MINKSLFILFLLIIAKTLNGQGLNPNSKRVYQNIRNKNLEKVFEDIKSIDSSSVEFLFFKWEIELLLTGKNNDVLHKSILSKKTKSKIDNILKKIHLGDYYSFVSKKDSAYKKFYNALELSKSTSDSILICKVINEMLSMFSRDSTMFRRSYKYINQYKNYAYNDLENFYVQYYSSYFNQQKLRFRNKDAFLDSLDYEKQLAIKSNNYFTLIEHYQKNGVFYEVFQEDEKRAIVYYDKALEILDNQPEYHFLMQRKKGILSNLGVINYLNNDFKNASNYFRKAFEIKSTKKRLKNDLEISNWRGKTFLKMLKPDSALYYFKLKDELRKELNQISMTSNIEKLDRTHNILIEKSKKRIVIIVFSIILLCVLISGFLIYEAQLKKRKLVEKEKEFLLKEQELQSIDAMVEGQEKERQRIANELHDNLGGLLATLKLYVQNLKVKKHDLDEQHDLIIKNTDEVLEEAYQKVRAIAQTRNAGVLTSEGLIPTIQNYAAKVSASNSLVVEVADYGMEQRLNNSIEITIFRIVQELITNVIKHANAKEIAIDITNHKKSINLIIEDNGDGFDIEKIKPKLGMGLSSIKKRVEGLNGSLSIDSHIAKGTTIIIDIPLTQT